MRKCLGVLMLCTFLLAFGTTAEAANVSATWTGAVNNNWSNAGNWNAALPEGTGTATIPDTSTVFLDTSQSVGIVLMNSGTVGNAVLNITNGSNLTINKGSAQSFGISVITAGSGTVNHSAGIVTVGTGAVGGTAETRLCNVDGAIARYNLSGTGVLDTEVLNKGAKARDGQFNATGGTLVVRNLINKFGRIAENASYGFNQGQAKLEVGAISTVAAIGVGKVGDAMDYAVGTGGTLNFDIASASSYDKVLQFGDLANTAGATLGIDLLGGYTPAVGSFFDVWTFSAYTNQTTTSRGSGTFASISSGWTAAWVDTNADLTTDTLRLTYVPEPATIALLGLGLLAIRRNKK